jgi:hypothetical protein
LGGGLVAVGQVLRGMQRTGGEGWTAVPLVCGCVHGEGGRCAVACVLPCVVCSAAALRCWSRRVCLGRKNTTVKGLNVMNRIWGVEMKMELNPKSV